MEASPTGTLGFSRPSLNGGQSSNPPFGSRPFTDEERLEINRKLKQCLGSEYMANRSGPGGGKLTYLEGYRAISLAHEIFGFDGWSHSILETSVDYVGLQPSYKHIVRQLYQVDIRKEVQSASGSQ
ncbi:hypothetical protein BC829DRAFT_438974 [Chytridium lagenaria]|nr:hypothetical protein BC829DRAFT_438974 [Chytridium lagenaria]